MSCGQNGRKKFSMRLIAVPLEGWKSSDIWEQHWGIETVFRKKL